MRDVDVEFASTSRALTAYQGLAKWAGVPLQTVADHARDGRLGELVETRQHTRPLSGREALRRIEEKRNAPTAKSGARALGELRAKKVIWQAQEDAALRSRDPYQALAEIYAKQIPDWWDE